MFENQPWGVTHYTVDPGSHVSFQTKKQQVDLITNPHFGRMLFLDGVLQSTSADEHIYHEAMVSAGMRPHSKKVLIAGGSEGAVAREVFKWAVESVTMVDWDSELVEHLSKKEKMNENVWTDSRLNYICEDILKFCQTNRSSFDTVFLDLLDVETISDMIFLRSILFSLQVAAKDAVMIVNIGRNRKYAEAFHCEIIEVNVPSFQEPWYFIKYTY